jgi:hypothetical protein
MAQYKPHFDEMMMISALYKMNMLCWIFIGLVAHLNNYPWKSNKYQIHSLWFDLTDARTQFYRTWGENANHYTTDAVLSELLGRLDMYPICGRTGVFSVVGA